MYGAYLAEQRDVVSHGGGISRCFLAWHRPRQWDMASDRMVFRGGGHQQANSQTMVVACWYWYELTDGFWGQFGVTQLPHRHPREILPTGRHLESQLNFAGILEFLSSWSWRGEGLVVSCLLYTSPSPRDS